MIIDTPQPYRSEIIALLTAEKLPTVDLPHDLADFIIEMEDEVIIGVAGLEVYHQYGLLRSFAVSPQHRNKGIAGKLLHRIEVIAALKRLKGLYLLTETAPGYFEQRGYSKITRLEVPDEVMNSSEFRLTCPASAIVMKKTLS